MSHFLQSILLLGLLVGRKFRVEPGSCADQAQPGAAQAKRAASAKLRAWSRDGKIGRGRLSRSYAAACGAAYHWRRQPRNRPGHARLSGRHCMPPVVHACRAAASRPSNQARPAAAAVALHRAVHPPAPARSYIGKSKSNLKLKRWIAVTKCTSLNLKVKPLFAPLTHTT